MKTSILLATLLCVGFQASALPDTTTTYTTPEGIQFELPDHWERLNLLESLILGATTGYFNERRSNEEVKALLREAKNIVVATSPRIHSSDPEDFFLSDPDVSFSINLVPLPDGQPLSQDQFRNYSDADRQAFLARSETTSDKTVQEMNKASNGFALMRRTANGFRSTDHLYCAGIVYVTDYSDQTSSEAEILFCPIGETALMIDLSITTTASEREILSALKAVNSVLISDSRSPN